MFVSRFRPDEQGGVALERLVVEDHRRAQGPVGIEGELVVGRAVPVHESEEVIARSVLIVRIDCRKRSHQCAGRSIFHNEVCRHQNVGRSAVRDAGVVVGIRARGQFLRIAETVPVVVGIGMILYAVAV